MQKDGLKITSTDCDIMDFQSDSGPSSSGRYSRHVLLPQVGIDGVQRLSSSSVICVGAGGLGSPALLYLAAAGIGNITIIDDDKVECRK